MNSKRLTASIAALAMLLGLSVEAAASNSHHRAQYDYAKVVSARPIIRYVTVKEPVRECWHETQYYTTHHRPPGNAGRTLLGAAIGGVIGHQFGSGRGNDAATIAGALIGGAVANESGYANGQYGRTQHSRPVRRCETRYRRTKQERIDGYDVIYRYRGQKYQTRMPYDPGNRLKIRVDVRPARY
ncbi:MAG: glycine zipper 2TM domain-containing protein [Pseudomonadota bacterium]